MTREVVVVSGVRTAIGTFGGSLKDLSPTEMGALVVREAWARAQVKGDEVGHVGRQVPWRAMVLRRQPVGMLEVVAEQLAEETDRPFVLVLGAGAQVDLGEHEVPQDVERPEHRR